MYIFILVLGVPFHLAEATLPFLLFPWLHLVCLVHETHLALGLVLRLSHLQLRGRLQLRLGPLARGNLCLQ